VQKGRLSEAKGDLADAKKLYESSIAISPTHIKSLHRLVGVLFVSDIFGVGTWQYANHHYICVIVT